MVIAALKALRHPKPAQPLFCWIIRIDPWESVARLFLWSAVQLAIDAGIPHDGLHVFPGFGERDGFHEFGGIAVGPLSYPFLDAVGAGVVGGQRVLERSAELVDHSFEIARAEFEID